MNKQKTPSFGQTVSLLALGLVLMMGVSILVVNVGGMLISGPFGPDPVAMLLLNDIGAYVLGLPLAMLIWSFLPGDAMPITPKKPLSAGLFAGFGLLTFGAGYAASFVTQMVLMVLDLPTAAPVDMLMQQLPPWAGFLLVALSPAILEEAVFRGILYKKLARFGEAPYVILSGLFFATFHGNLSQMLFAFVIGCCLALVTSRTGSMLYGMFLHFLVNFLSACVILPLSDWPLLEVILGVWILASMAGALVFALSQRRGLKLQPGKNLPEHPVRAALCNPGMILWLMLIAVMVVLTLFY